MMLQLYGVGMSFAWHEYVKSLSVFTVDASRSHHKWCESWPSASRRRPCQQRTEGRCALAAARPSSTT